jgi:hypothetical protein
LRRAHRPKQLREKTFFSCRFFHSIFCRVFGCFSA